MSKGYAHLIGRRTVVGRGRRRTGLLVLLALPVLLATLAAGLFSSAAPSAEQRGTSTIGRGADGYLSHSDSLLTDKLAAELRQRAPGMTVLPADENSQFPVWSKDHTVTVRYVDTDWSSPLLEGRYRVLEGRFPSDLGEIAVSRALAEAEGLKIGDSLPYRWKRDAPAQIVGLIESPQAHAAYDYLAAPGQLRAWPKTGTDTTNVLPSSFGLLVAGNPEQIGAAQEVAGTKGLQLLTKSGIAGSRTMIEREPALLLAPGILVLGVIAAGAFALRMRRTRAEFAILAGIGLPDRELRYAAISGAVWAGLIAVPAGWLAGSLLVIAARPILPSITDKDNAPYDPLLIGGVLTILLSVAAASLAAVLTTRYPAGVPARERARTPARSDKRGRLWTPVLGGLAAVGIAVAMAFQEDELISSIAAVVASTGSERTAPQTLGWTCPKIRTPDAADRWAWPVLVAYTQLRLVRPLAADRHRPWERPVPAGRLTPARLRRDFRHIRPTVTCPAGAPKPTRPGPDRPPGRKNTRPTPRHDVHTVRKTGTVTSRNKQSTTPRPRRTG
ncbi:hypothetical protein [Streptomyces hydrogenans]|uniref:hypothetical protein n=1 Tax=Streptomyces hydrogenans TaxID=1873719 RepID=UPI0033BA181B